MSGPPFRYPVSREIARDLAASYLAGERFTFGALCGATVLLASLVGGMHLVSGDGVWGERWPMALGLAAFGGALLAPFAAYSAARLRRFQRLLSTPGSVELVVDGRGVRLAGVTLTILGDGIGCRLLRHEPSVRYPGGRRLHFEERGRRGLRHARAFDLPLPTDGRDTAPLQRYLDARGAQHRGG